jgi:hypothetical protein
MTGVRVLMDPEFLKNVKEEFKEKTKIWYKSSLVKLFICVFAFKIKN